MRDSREGSVMASVCAAEIRMDLSNKSCRMLSEKSQATRAAIRLAMMLHQSAPPAQRIITTPQRTIRPMSSLTTTFLRMWLNMYGSASSTSVPSTLIEMPTDILP